jgi:hypothetical protein
MLEETIFEMDEVIVSTVNKIQSQNVMKVEHESYKILTAKGDGKLIEGLATIPGVSSFYWYIYWEASYSRIERKQGFSFILRVFEWKPTVW